MIRDRLKLPRLYFVNWFRKDPQGKFLWPGYGENSRVLKWICERIDGTAKAVETPIGNLPAPGTLDVTGLSLAPDALKDLLAVDIAGWKKEAEDIGSYYTRFGDRLPPVLSKELASLKDRLDKAR